MLYEEKLVKKNLSQKFSNVGILKGSSQIKQGNSAGLRLLEMLKQASKEIPIWWNRRLKKLTQIMQHENLNRNYVILTISDNIAKGLFQMNYQNTPDEKN